MNGKVYVVEDIAYTRANIISILEENNFEVAGSSAIASRAWEQIFDNGDKIDLVLIDVHLTGEKDGTWLAEKIGLELNIPFVFITAYDDSITTSAILRTKPYGYILKPFKKTELITVVNVAIEKHKEFQSKGLNNDNRNNLLYVRVGSNTQKINLNQLNYLQSDGNYIYFFEDLQKFIVRSTLSKALDILPEDKFIRVHQRYVVSIEKIDSFNSKYLKIGDQKIPISKSYKKEVKSKLSTANLTQHVP